MMFDLDQFIADCRASLVEDATHKSVREVVARAVSDPGAVLKGLGVRWLRLSEQNFRVDKWSLCRGYRRAERQRVEVGLIGRASVKARMRPMAVVEVDVAAERSSRLVDAVIGPQIHLLVFDTAPEALEEHVIAPRAPAVH